MSFKILIVEDESVTALDLEQRLAAWGYSPIGPFSRGERALAAVAAGERPDLALIDIQLIGELDGIATAAEMKARWGIPAIYLTAFATDAILARAKLTEPLGYLVKPYTELGMRATLEMAVAKLGADRRLRAREAELVRFRTTLNETGDCVFMFAPDTLQFFYVNRGASEQVGYTEAELLGMHPYDLKPEYPEPRFRELIAPLLEGRQASLRFETLHRRKDGREVPVEAFIQYIAPAGEPPRFVNIVTDITERRKAQRMKEEYAEKLKREVADRTEELKKANEQLKANDRFTRATLDALRSAIVVLDEQGVVVSSNRAANELAQARGFSAEEFAAGADYLAGFMKSSHAPAAAGALVAGIREVLAGKRLEFELEYDWHLPKQPQWFVCRASRFEGEGPVRVVVSNMDNTPMKVLQDQHNRSQRMESLGTLAGGIAHDLNNALAPILLGLELVVVDKPENEKTVDMMRASGQRAASMVRQLLTFAKGTKGERVPLGMKNLILEIQKILAGTLPKDIQMIVHTAAKQEMILGDPTQLHQVLLNLCVNARDAMPRGGKIEIQEEVREVDEIFAAGMGHEGKAGRYVVVSVKDTGTGMSPEVMERIFEPFFTTKGPDKGTGLGLATVLGIVKSHEGFVQVQSKVGEGTSFSVYLPLAEEAKTSDTQIISKAEVLHRGNGETVLLVDDEAPIREIGSAILKRLNYNPVVAANGLDGLIKLAELRKELRMIITDLEMPDLNGIQFVQAVRLAMPEIPIIIASGSINEKDKFKLAGLKISGMLNKPFSEQQLGEMLRKINLQHNSPKQFTTKNNKLPAVIGPP